MTVKTNGLSAELFLQLYASVGWEPPGIEQVQKALENTIATFTAYDEDKAVGMVRLIGDGGMTFYIKDFAVVPEYQSMGVGTLLLNALEDYIKEHIAPGWAVSMELISSKEAVGFYQKHGFVTVGRRKGYYEAPREDAILMTKFWNRGTELENTGI